MFFNYCKRKNYISLFLIFKDALSIAVTVPLNATPEVNGQQVYSPSSSRYTKTNAGPRMVSAILSPNKPIELPRTPSPTHVEGFGRAPSPNQVIGLRAIMEQEAEAANVKPKHTTAITRYETSVLLFIKCPVQCTVRLFWILNLICNTFLFHLFLPY